MVWMDVVVFFDQVFEFFLCQEDLVFYCVNWDFQVVGNFFVFIVFIKYQEWDIINFFNIVEDGFIFFYVDIYFIVVRNDIFIFNCKQKVFNWFIYIVVQFFFVVLINKGIVYDGRVLVFKICVDCKFFVVFVGMYGSFLYQVFCVFLVLGQFYCKREQNIF